MKTKKNFLKTGITFFLFFFVVSLFGQNSIVDLKNKREQAKQQNQYKESIEFNRKIIELTPKDNTFSNNFDISYAYYSMGYDLYNLGRYSEALESFNYSYKYENMHCYDMIAMCFERLEKYDDAIANYYKHIDSYRIINLNQGQRVTFTDEGYSYSIIYPKDLAASLYSIGNIYLNQKKDYTKSLELMNKALKLSSTNVNALIARAKIYNKLNMVPLQIEDLKKAVLVGGKDAIICANDLGIHYFNEGNYKDSYFYLKSAIDNGLKNAESNKLRGFSAYKLQLYDDAVASYKKALELNPSIVIDQESKKIAEQYVNQQKESERQRALAIETKRLNEIRNAGIGDKLIYSEGWYNEGGFFTPTTSWDMVVTCFIERKEGNNYQLRVGDVKSTNSNHYNSPTINGVKVSKGDIIWAKPLVGGKWIYGE